MAVKPAERTDQGAWQIFTWSAVTENDTFAVPAVEGRPRSATLYVGGTFGSATVIAEGSNDGTNWVALDDVEDAAISHTSAGGSEFRYAWPKFRVSASGGSSQSINATLAVMVD